MALKLVVRVAPHLCRSLLNLDYHLTQWLSCSDLDMMYDSLVVCATVHVTPCVTVFCMITYV